MKILNIRPPVDHASNARFQELARFDIELTPDCRIYGLRLVKASGTNRLLTHAPSNGGIRLATFSQALADQITAAASAGYDVQIGRRTNAHARQFA